MSTKRGRSLDPDQYADPREGIVGELSDTLRELVDDDLKAGAIDATQHAQATDYLRRVSPPAAAPRETTDTDGRI